MKLCNFVDFVEV